jgi:hypothetical protein
MMRKFLTKLGIVLIVLPTPEPISDLLGVIALVIASRLGERRRLVNSSGVVIRSGRLPQQRWAY